MMLAPTNVPIIDPTPPKRLVPPIITDAITLVPNLHQRLELKNSSLQPLKIPTKAANDPVMQYAIIFTALIFIPDIRDVSSLPPIA